jgi:hypothetical protein
MHGAATTTATARGTTIQLGQHGLETTALGQIMSMRAMVAEYHIVLGERGAHSHGDGFLSDAQVHWATDFLLCIARSYRFFDTPDAQHGSQQRQILCFC